MQMQCRPAESHSLESDTRGVECSEFRATPFFRTEHTRITGEQMTAKSRPPPSPTLFVVALCTQGDGVCKYATTE